MNILKMPTRVFRYLFRKAMQFGLPFWTHRVLSGWIGLKSGNCIGKDAVGLLNPFLFSLEFPALSAFLSNVAIGTPSSLSELGRPAIALHYVSSRGDCSQSSSTSLSESTVLWVAVRDFRSPSISGVSGLAILDMCVSEGAIRCLEGAYVMQ